MSAARPAIPLARVLLSVGGIYIAQTLVSGLTFRAVPTVLRSMGAPLDLIGLVSLAMLPWGLKFLWAPAVERYRLPGNGRRRSRNVVLAGQILVVFCIAVIALTSTENVVLMLALLGIAATAAATIDVACDAYAVEQLSSRKRGWANVAQVGGSYLGAVLGSGLFLILFAKAGWAIAGLTMAILVAGLTIPFVLGDEPDAPAAPPHRPSLAFALRRREVRIGLVLTAVFTLAASLAQSLLSPLLVDRGVSVETIGIINSMGSVGAGVTGTLIGGALVSGIGSRGATIIAAVLQFLVLTALAAIVAFGGDVAILIAGVVALVAAMAVGFVALYSLLMDLSSLKQAGVDFTLFQCANALVLALVGFGAGVAAERAGYVLVFTAAAGLGLAALIATTLLLRMLPKPQ